MESGGIHKENIFSKEVSQKEKRMLKARDEHKRSPWAGFGLFGIIGWSVVTPTLGGAALGRWLDKKYPAPLSWTLSFIIIGLVIGCMVAWHWIKKEHKEMYQKQ